MDPEYGQDPPDGHFKYGEDFTARWSIFSDVYGTRNITFKKYIFPHLPVLNVLVVLASLTSTLGSPAAFTAYTEIATSLSKMLDTLQYEQTAVWVPLGSILFTFGVEYFFPDLELVSCERVLEHSLSRGPRRAPSGPPSGGGDVSA